MCVSCGPEIVGAFGWQEVWDEFADLTPEAFDGSLWVLPEQGLELCEGHLDGVHVWRVGRQEKKLRADGFDGGTHGRHLMGGKIVHDDDVSGLQCGGEGLADVGKERPAVHGAVENHRGGEAGQPQGADERGGFPMPERHGGQQPLTTWRPAMEADHLRIQAGLVDEDQALGVNEAPRRLPDPAPEGNVGPILFGGAQRFFYR